MRKVLMGMRRIMIIIPQKGMGIIVRLNPMDLFAF